MKDLLQPARIAAFVVVALVAIRRGAPALTGNECDVLPVARHFVQAAFIPHDWYLNLSTAYRVAFNVIAGPLVASLGLPWGALVGRMACAFAFALGVAQLCSTLKLSLPRSLLFAAVASSGLSLGAGEWMTGAFEAKAAAYPCVLLALVALLRASPRRAGALLGLALTFHVLVGLQAIFCLGAGALGTTSLRRSLHRAALVTLVTGSPGLLALVRHARTAVGPASAEGSRIYTEVRVPHHLNVSWTWVALALALVIVTWLAHGRRRDDASRLLMLVAAATIPLIAIGWLAQSLPWPAVQKMYWYRFADVMLPVLACLAVLHAAASWEERSGPRSSAAVALLGILVAVLHAGRTRLTAPDPRFERLTAWIRENTAPADVFLVDPAWDCFYAQAERPMLVSFKAVPQQEPDIVEWFDRLSACEGKPPTARGFAVEGEVESALFRITDSRLQSLAQRYSLSYFVTPVTRPAGIFETAYSDGTFRVVDLRATSTTAGNRRGR